MLKREGLIMRKKAWYLGVLLAVLLSGGCQQEAEHTEIGNPSVTVTEAIQEDSAVETEKDIEENEAENTVETEEETEETPITEMTDHASIEAVRAAVWEKYITDITQDEERIKEVEEQVMPFGEVVMKYGMQIKGKPDENGYPLYIALHGGGETDINDQQWAHMSIYYGQLVKNAIYINPRGVRDTCDTHANPESFPLYDRLIENIVAFYGADPNRVYLLGFSAGGDGVYLVTPKMTDRFAAANMSACYSSGMNMTNLYNMPLYLQVGMLDTAYERNTLMAKCDAIMNQLTQTYGGGYEHKTFIHTNYGHNFYDNSYTEQEVLVDPAAWLETGDTTSVRAKTNAVNLLKVHTRDPLPKRVIWDLTTRATLRDVESFYWLSASHDVNEGIIIASYDTETNSITIEENTTNGPITVLINNNMLDVFSPITVHTPTESIEVTVTPDYELLKHTTYERGDRNYQFVAKIVIE